MGKADNMAKTYDPSAIESSMYKKWEEKGYFKEGIKSLDVEHETHNYEKAIMWAEKGILPEYLNKDMKMYNGIKLIKE